MTRRPSQSGESKLSLLFWLALFVVGAMVGWQYIPARVQQAEIKDFMKEQAKFANKLPEKQLRDHIYNEAMRLRIPVDKKAIEVKKSHGRIIMSIEYAIDMEFPGYLYVHRVEENVDMPVYDW